MGECFQVAFGLVGLPVLPKVFQQFAHFGGVFGAAGGFFGGVGGGFGGVPFGGVCIGQDAVGFVDVFAVFGKGVVQVLPSGGIGAGEFAFAVIDVFGVAGKLCLPASPAASRQVCGSLPFRGLPSKKTVSPSVA